MIILAGVVIVSLQDNNPIKKAKEASFKGDLSAFKSELNISLSNKIFEDTNLNREDVDELTYDGIKKYIPSFPKKYENILAIIDSELVFIGPDEDNRKWAEETDVPAGSKPVVPPTNYIGVYKFGPNAAAYFTKSEEASTQQQIYYDVTVLKDERNEGDGKGIINTKSSDGYGLYTDPIKGKDLDSIDEVHVNNFIIGEGIEEIAKNAFDEDWDCIILINNLVFPKSMKKIGMWGFGAIEIKNIKFNDELNEIGKCSFNFEGKKLELPKKLKIIDESAFTYTSEIEEVIMYNYVEKISKNAFSNCYKLKKINIPNSVKNIEGDAFFRSKNLNLVIPKTVEIIGTATSESYSDNPFRDIGKSDGTGSVTFDGTEEEFKAKMYDKGANFAKWKEQTNFIFKK